MATMWIGGEEVDAGSMLAEQKFCALLIEQQIVGLQEFLETRYELIRWLEDIQDE